MQCSGTDIRDCRVHYAQLPTQVCNTIRGSPMDTGYSPPLRIPSCMKDHHIAVHEVGAHPVGQHGLGRQHQVGPGASLVLGQRRHQRHGLHRLSKPHLVRKHSCV